MARISLRAVDHFALHKSFLLSHKKALELSALEWTNYILHGDLLWLCDVRNAQLEVCWRRNLQWQCHVFRYTLHHPVSAHNTNVSFHPCVLLAQKNVMGRAHFLKKIRLTTRGLHRRQRRQMANRGDDSPIHGQENPLRGCCSWNERDALVSARSDLNDHLLRLESPLEFSNVLEASEENHWDLERANAAGGHLLCVPLLRPGLHSLIALLYRVCLHRPNQHQHYSATCPDHVHFCHHRQTLVKESKSTQSRETTKAT